MVSFFLHNEQFSYNGVCNRFTPTKTTPTKRLPDRHRSRRRPQHTSNGWNLQGSTNYIHTTVFYPSMASTRKRCKPLVYALLADKRADTYYSVLDLLKRKLLELDLVLNPEMVMSDFESGLIPTLRSHFPNSNIKGCYFHHCRAIWTKV